jgi:hypothetical protein
MKETKGFITSVIGGLISIMVAGLTVWILWDNCMPQLFGLPEAGYLQCVALCAIVRFIQK